VGREENLNLKNNLLPSVDKGGRNVVELWNTCRKYDEENLLQYWKGSVRVLVLFWLHVMPSQAITAVVTER